MTRFPIPPAGPAELRRSDGVVRRRLGRQLLGAQAEFLERSYLTSAEVAQILGELAAQWAQDTAAREAAELAARWDATALPPTG